MSSHESGHGPAGVPENEAARPIDRNPHMERNMAEQQESKEEQWETAVADDSFKEWLNGHDEFKLVDQNDLDERLKWYKFFKQTKYVKERAPELHKDTIQANFIKHGIKVPAVNEYAKEIQGDVEALTQTGIVESGPTAMDTMERVSGLMEEYETLTGRLEKGKKKLAKEIEICFPLGDSRERFKKAVASLNDWHREQEVHKEAQKALEDAEKELQTASQSRSGVVNRSKHLVGKFRGMFKRGEQQSAPDELEAAKAKIDEAKRVVAAAAKAVSQIETSLCSEFRFEKSELKLNLKLVQRLHREEQSLDNAAIRVAQIRKEMADKYNIGKNALYNFVKNLEEGSLKAKEQVIQSGKEAEAREQAANPAQPARGAAHAGQTEVPKFSFGEAEILDSKVPGILTEMGVSKKDLKYQIDAEVIREARIRAVDHHVNKVKEMVERGSFKEINKFRRELDKYLVEAFGNDQYAKDLAKLTIAGQLQKYLDTNRTQIGAGKIVDLESFIKTLAPNGISK